MPEYLDATGVTWIEKLPTEKPISPITDITKLGISDALAKHTVQVTEGDDKPVGAWTAVLLADAAYWEGN